MKTLTIIGLNILGLFPILANSLNEVLDQFYDKVELSQNFNGVIAINEGDSLKKTLATGQAYIDNTQHLHSDHQFCIGSISKQFTGAAILKVLASQYNPCQDGPSLQDFVKTQLQYPIAHFLPPSHHLWQNHPPHWVHQVTLHQLLTHTSGIPNYTDLEIFRSLTPENKLFMEMQHTPEQTLDLVLEKDLLFEPGTQTLYGNTAYFILAQIIQELSHQSLSSHLQETFFSPLGMPHTHSPEKGTLPGLQKEERFKNLVDSIAYNPLKPQAPNYSTPHYIDFSLAQGAGSIISTVKDLVRWNQMLHVKGRVLPQELYQLMVPPLSETDEELEGYGVGLEKSPYGTIIGHQGSIDNFDSVLYYFPNHDTTVIILSNLNMDISVIINHFKSQGRTLSEQEFEAFLENEYPPVKGFFPTFKLLTEHLKK